MVQEQFENKLVKANFVPDQKLVFPDPKTRPSIRAFNDWKKKGYFPSIKIGKRVFVDPAMVRKALDAKFTVHA